MNIGQKVNYYGTKATVLKTQDKYCLIQLESGSKICTPISTFIK